MKNTCGVFTIAPGKNRYFRIWRLFLQGNQTPLSNKTDRIPARKKPSARKRGGICVIRCLLKEERPGVDCLPYRRIVMERRIVSSGTLFRGIRTERVGSRQSRQFETGQLGKHRLNRNHERSGQIFRVRSSGTAKLPQYRSGQRISTNLGFRSSGLEESGSHGLGSVYEIRKFFQYVFGTENAFRGSVSNKGIRSHASLPVHVARNRENLFSKIESQPGGNEASGFLCRFRNESARGIGGHERVTDGKVVRVRSCGRRESRNDGSTGIRYRAEKLRIRPRIVDVDSRSNECVRRGSAPERGGVRHGVDSRSSAGNRGNAAT